MYYSYDENNIAANDYPIGVLGAEQQFNFPTVYLARKRANESLYNMSLNRWEQKRLQLAKEVSLAYYHVVYEEERCRLHQMLDTIYTRYAHAAEISHEQGDLSYLEMLHARSKAEQFHIQRLAIEEDIDIAYRGLKVLIQSDTLFRVPGGSMERLKIQHDTAKTDPGFQYYQNTGFMLDAAMKAEKGMLLPDITLGYFNGTNRYEGSRYYQGFEVGLGIPLFFGEQRARLKAGRLAKEALEQKIKNYRLSYENRISVLKSRLKKIEDAISYYEETGGELARELIRSSRKSFERGEIDYFRFAQSMDQALEIELNQLENLLQYNTLVLEINYMTMDDI